MKITHNVYRICCMMLICCIPFIQTDAQKINDNWVFGNHGGVTFCNNNVPQVLPGTITNNMNQDEGVASVSDDNCNLLFYTDGRYVYRADGTHMTDPGGNDTLNGSPTSTQSAIIVPQPGSTTRYYIFTNRSTSFAGIFNGFRYSIVDMSLIGVGGAAGNIAVADVILYKDSASVDTFANTEKVAAVHKCNGKDYWILTHEYAVGDFIEYSLTSSGVTWAHNYTIGSPYISHPFNVNFSNTGGYLKFSPDGRKLANALFVDYPGTDDQYGGGFELYDFNTFTGVLSNCITVQKPNYELYTSYGVEFSADTKYLYLSTDRRGTTAGSGVPFADLSTIYQFDITSTNPATIAASGYLMASQAEANYYGALQMAPDGNIYAAQWDQTTLGRIDNPSTLHPAYNPTAVAVGPAGSKSRLGLPNNISQELDFKGGYSNQNGTTCDSFFIGNVNSPATGYTYHWSSLTPSSPDPSPNNIPYVKVHPLVTTVYQLIVTRTDTPVCVIDTLYDTVSVTCCRPVAMIYSADTICFGGYDTIRISGGVWGKIIIDGSVLQDNPSDTNWVFPVDSFIAGGGLVFPVRDTSAIGSHHVCYIAYSDNPDSTQSFCADTTCKDFVIMNCCVKPKAVLDFTDTACVGNTYTIRASGGAYGQIYTDYGSDGIFPISVFTTGITVGPVDGGDNLGTHSICFIAMSDTTAWACRDTVCSTFTVINCTCDHIQATMTQTQTGPMSFDFMNQSAEVPDFVQWSVDGVSDDQTDGHTPLSVMFSSEGKHIVCMHAGYIKPSADGHSICCYKDVCDTVFIDGCDEWRATDSVSYTYDSLDYHKLNFSYSGQAPTSIVWDFGDGDKDYSSNSVNVSHTFSGDGLHTVCAYVVWSLHDSANCCCLDTICTSLDISPCSVTSFNIVNINHEGDEYTFQLTHSNAFITMKPVRWTISNAFGTLVSSSHGVILDYIANSAGVFDICAYFGYNIPTPDGKVYTCYDSVCITDTIAASSVSPKIRAYPNPTTGDVIVEFTNYNEAATAQVEISNMTGQILMTKSIEGVSKGVSQHYMDLSKIPTGMYLIKVSIGDVKQIDKLVKQ